MDTVYFYLLELARFIPICIVMGYAALADYKTGEVPNKIWLSAIPGGLLTLLETFIFFSVGLLLLTLITIGICVGVGFLLYALGGGGADSKALMFMAISAPFLPLWGLYPLPLPLIAMLIGSVSALPFILFSKSKEPLWKRKIRFLPFLFIGLIVCVIL